MKIRRKGDLGLTQHPRLMTLLGLSRKKMENIEIAHFSHVPFPSRSKIAQGLLNAD